MNKIFLSLLTFLCTISSWAAATNSSKPKYGPAIKLMRYQPQYFRQHAASDFWALIGYYNGHPGDCSCTTSITTVLNALRDPRQLDSETKLISPADLVAKIKSPIDLGQRLSTKKGLNLDELAQVLTQALQLFELKSYSVSIHHINDRAPAKLAQLRRDLLSNEKSDRNFIIINFNQGTLTGDADAGHVSVIAGYDPKKQQVLILDADREWYEPYWVSDQDLLKALASYDSDAKSFRGYLKVGF